MRVMRTVVQWHGCSKVYIATKAGVGYQGPSDDWNDVDISPYADRADLKTGRVVLDGKVKSQMPQPGAWTFEFRAEPRKARPGCLRI